MERVWSHHFPTAEQIPVQHHVIVILASHKICETRIGRRPDDNGKAELHVTVGLRIQLGN